MVIAKYPPSKHLNILVTICIQMVTTQETTVKMSKWLVDKIEKHINKNLKNKSEFPSKRNFVDRAVMKLLEEQGVNLDEN